MMKYIFLVIFLMPMSCTAQSQLEMNTQAFKDYEKADAKMTLLYKKVLKTFTAPTSKKLFLDGQRAWIKFKEAHCKSVANTYEGGSMKPLVYSSCLTELTNNRIKQLYEYLNTN